METKILYLKFDKIYTKLLNKFIPVSNNNIYISHSDNNNIVNSKFIDTRISKKIKQNKIKYNLQYKYKKWNIKINIFTEDEDNNLIKLFNNILFRIILIIMFIENTSKPKDLILNIYLTDEEKKIHYCKKEILGPLNSNSGLTDGISITIFRKEELLKLVIHEIIHFYNIDIKTRNIFCKECYTNMFNIESNIIINESFVETWSTLLNLLFISNSLQEFNDLLEKEILFSLEQVAKILINYNFNSYEEFLKENKSLSLGVKELRGAISLHRQVWSGGEKKIIKQKTSVFSYYIVKSIFLHSILFNKLNFLTIFLNINYNHNNIFNYSNQIIQLLKENYNNHKIIFTINYFINNLKNNCNKNSFRMTKKNTNYKCKYCNYDKYN